MRALPQNYKGVTLIENPYWDSCNNIASLYVAREQLENAMILDGDQIIYKKRNSCTGIYAFWLQCCLDGRKDG